ncbi:gluconokinase [Cellulomonas sp. KRMCY2]|uniref:gluconokinase n=1 Tax=Cellulomonas sp. KRMCY2 TaxID=1304865 RepID=UPI00045E97A4|nr:gluconokinase [Cellulomonas sp. KRMCY2]
MADDARPGPPAQHLVIMGVAGSGKTTLAEVLADRLGWPYAEADDFHPPANVQKMAAGIALTDDDRWPWLRALRDWLTEQSRAGRSSIVTCSALRSAYRDVLGEAEGTVRFVHLTAAPEVIGNRLATRVGHFMPAALLPSQLGTLEPLRDSEDGVTVVVDAPPDVVADRVLEALGLGAGQS